MMQNFRNRRSVQKCAQKPIGVLNVVKYENFSSSLICRNPDLASNTENILAFSMSDMTSLIVFIEWCSRFIARYKSFGYI